MICNYRSSKVKSKKQNRFKLSTSIIKYNLSNVKNDDNKKTVLRFSKVLYDICSRINFHRLRSIKINKNALNFQINTYLSN